MKQKTFILLLFIVSMTVNSMAQTVRPTGSTKAETSYDADKMPSFPGGEQALFQFLSKNIQYPTKAMEAGVQGSILMSFAIDKNGSITDITAKDCTISSYDKKFFDKLTVEQQEKLKKECILAFAKEGVRLIRLMPNWKPGESKGKKVKALYRLPINFKQ